MDEEKKLSELEADVVAATEKLEEASREESYARSRRCTATNNLAAAQRALDMRIAAMKSSAPNESHWGEQRRDRDRPFGN